jgi:hypothetical protein
MSIASRWDRRNLATICAMRAFLLEESHTISYDAFNEHCIFIYNLHSPFISAVCFVSHFVPDCHSRGFGGGEGLRRSKRPRPRVRSYSLMAARKQRSSEWSRAEPVGTNICCILGKRPRIFPTRLERFHDFISDGSRIRRRTHSPLLNVSSLPGP